MTHYFKNFYFLIALVYFTLSCNKKTSVQPENLSVSKSRLLVSVDSISFLSNDQIKSLAFLFGGGQMTDKFKFGVVIYKVIYKSTFQNNPILASGLLYMPQGLIDAAPILSTQHGTTFIKSDAPSEKRTFSGLELFASAGYITLTADYIGYGASASLYHPYYQAENSALNVIDFIKSTTEYLDSKHVKYKSDLYLTGYSEGGYVTLASQKELESKPLPNLKVKAVTAGAGGYDLEEMLNNIQVENFYSYPAYLAFLVNSYDKVYNWNKGLNYYFNSKYGNKLDTLLDGNTSGNYINSQLTTNMDSLFNTKFFAGLRGNSELDFKKVLKENSLTYWSPKAPIQLYHGTNDEVIPYKNSETTKSKLVSNGGHIQLFPVEGGNHGSSLIPMSLATLNWFDIVNNRQN